MRQRPALFFLILVACMVHCVQEKTGQSDKKHRPNVILILTDDQGWGDLSMHGNKRLSTPVIDDMASRGAYFDRFYVSPLCAPTRASLLTGRYYLRTGVSWVSKGLENLNSDEVTLAEIFKAQGYRTGCFGKWHNGAHFPQHPNRQGFDEFIGFCAGHWNNYFSTTLERNGAPYPTEGYITDVLTAEAIRFIEKNKEREFFCYVPFNAPHGPFQVPDRYFDKYKEAGFNDKDAAVYGMCENIDDNLGKIRSKIDELGLTENTIIIFISDNGPNGKRYNGGMRGVKGSIHEGGVRVPCIIRWPGRVSPKVISHIAGHIDVLPTLVSMCNLDPPETLPLDGEDISDLILKPGGSMPDRLFFTKKSAESIVPDGAARDRRYRLVIERGDTMLFDMRSDPGQEIDIASAKAGITQSMALAYRNWFKDVMLDFRSDAEIRIGFEDEHSVYLPAHEAEFSGEIHYMEGHGWAHDWLVNWISKSDSVFWEVAVEESTKYRLDLLYCCAEENLGSELSVRCNGQTSDSEITMAYDPEYIPSPDRVKRIEVYEKKWAKLSLGELLIPGGSQQIVLKAKSIPNKMVGEIKGLMLTRTI